MYAYNMTAAEHYRVHGTVRRDHLEELFDQQAVLKALDGIDAHIKEARAQFPAEDFLSGVQSRLGDLLGKVRGSNREELQGIIEALSDIAQCTFNAADYGRSELDEALKVYEGAQP